ncbi:unnamed protein product [Prorocentrum cordatum]|uniref:Uncharacterized protein n=1 Tax=Prorocentrum cordatum TaxID=2364126 RepID=A0ABN9VQD1_9DINO|nr:unnamed protein product [Polarella glacialis]
MLPPRGHTRPWPGAVVASLPARRSPRSGWPPRARRREELRWGRPAATGTALPLPVVSEEEEEEEGGREGRRARERRPQSRMPRLEAQGASTASRRRRRGTPGQRRRWHRPRGPTRGGQGLAVPHL